MNLSEPGKFYIGKRLSFGGDLCTIRFIGEVKGTKGEWLGVEWDDVSRGKHDGSVKGVEYFQCLSKSPTAASFVRPNRPYDQPRTFVQALRHKYASGGIGRTSVGEKEANQPIRISGKEVEEVGFDKIRSRLADLKGLRIVLLDGLCVHQPLDNRFQDAEDPPLEEVKQIYSTFNDVREASPRIVELDLSRNLFEDWREVVAISSQLENLRSLRLDGNRFVIRSVSEAEIKYFESVFGKITSLSLEDTLLEWSAVVDISSLFASLATLAVSGNHFGSLSGGDLNSLPQTVTEMSLEYNDFTSLHDISALTAIPNLRKLVLKNNFISTTGPPSLTFPPGVSNIDLSHNSIDNWSFISTLSSVFPGLTSLRIAHNPLFRDLRAPDGRLLSPDDGYMLTIARLPGLKTLNYSSISDKDRLNAESYYLSLIALELSLADKSEEARIIERHPRFRELCDEYGEPTIRRSTEKKVNPSSLAAQLVKVRFHLDDSVDTQLTKDGRSKWPLAQDIELPKSLSMYSVLGIVGKQFDLPPWNLKLVWETEEWDFAASKHLESLEEEWDSEDEDQQQAGLGSERVKREVELLPGTRTLGTWTEGERVTVRVEMR